MSFSDPLQENLVRGTSSHHTWDLAWYLCQGQAFPCMVPTVRAPIRDGILSMCSFCSGTHQSGQVCATTWGSSYIILLPPTFASLLLSFPRDQIHNTVWSSSLLPSPLFFPGGTPNKSLTHPSPCGSQKIGYDWATEVHAPQLKPIGAELCLTLCDPMDCSPPGSSVHGILQSGILEWVVTPSSRGPSWPRDRTQVSRITGGFFTIWAIREAQLKICPTKHFPKHIIWNTTLRRCSRKKGLVYK